MRKKRLARVTASCLVFGIALAGLAVTPALAQPADQQVSGADQVVGLFGATCLHFAGDVRGLRSFLQQQNAPVMPQQARNAFLAGRTGNVYDVSYKTVKLALVSLDDGACEAVAENADPNQVLAVLDRAARENNVQLTPLGSQAPEKQRPGVTQNAFGLNLNGRQMHVLVSTSAAAPQAVLTLVPR